MQNPARRNRRNEAERTGRLGRRIYARGFRFVGDAGWDYLGTGRMYEKGRVYLPNSQAFSPRDRGLFKISLSGAGRSPARRARLCRAPELLRCGSDDKQRSVRGAAALFPLRCLSSLPPLRPSYFEKPSGAGKTHPKRSTAPARSKARCTFPFRPPRAPRGFLSAPARPCRRPRCPRRSGRTRGGG